MIIARTPQKKDIKILCTALTLISSSLTKYELMPFKTNSKVYINEVIAASKKIENGIFAF